MSNEKLSLTDRLKAAAAEGAAKAAEDLKATMPLEENIEKAKEAHAIGGYQGNHVKRLVLRNGAIVLPNEDGVFIPKSQEEFDMLEHLAASTTSSLEKLVPDQK